MQIIVNSDILDEGANKVGTINATIEVDSDSNIHGYVDAFVTALRAISFSDAVIYKGFKNYVESSYDSTN